MDDTPSPPAPLATPRPALTLETFDDTARAVAAFASGAAVWRCLDAVAWVSERHTDSIKVLWAYRDWAKRNGMGESERGTATVLQSRIDYEAAARLLLSALKAGSIIARDDVTGEAIYAEAWLSGGVAMRGGVYAVTFDSADLRERWPPTCSAKDRPALSHSGGAGRPTAMHLVRAELERRASAGELTVGVAAQCRELAAWYASQPEHRGLPPLKARSIQASLGPLYRQLGGISK